MTRLAPLLVIGALSGGLAACGDRRTPPAPPPEERPHLRRRRSPPKASSGAPPPCRLRPTSSGPGSISRPPRARAAAGVPPPSWRLPDGARRVVTIPRATGRVTPIAGNAPENGAEGDRIGGTDVESFGGISGIVHRATACSSPACS